MKCNFNLLWLHVWFITHINIPNNQESIWDACMAGVAVGFPGADTLRTASSKSPWDCFVTRLLEVVAKQLKQ